MKIKQLLILPMNYINVLKSLDLTGVSDEATFTQQSGGLHYHRSDLLATDIPVHHF